MFLKINGYILQEVPLGKDHVNQTLADAHVSVCTNTWTAEKLGNYYQSVAIPIKELSPEIMEYRNAAIEY